MANAYAGYNEISGGVVAMATPTGVGQVAGVYLIADGVVNYNLIDTTTVLTGNGSKEFNYSIKSNKKGVNTIPILVHHVPQEGDTLSSDGLIVKHTYYVKGSEVVN